jgi:hypothetical protein
MNKLEKIDQQEQRAREKITAMQAILKQIGEQRTEQENFQIIAKIRGLKLPREELYAFLGNGALPPSLLGMLAGNAAPEESETVYSQRGRPRRVATEETETPTFESEGLSHEEE